MRLGFCGLVSFESLNRELLVCGYGEVSDRGSICL